MITGVGLAAYAVLVGAAVPYVLAGARWPHRAPTAGVLAWQGLTVTFVVAAALAVYHLVLAEQHVHQGVVGLLSACGLAADAPPGDSPAGPADVALLMAPATIVLLPLGWLAATAWRTGRERRRHAGLLAVIGAEAADYEATVVDHDVPAVYCLPGRERRIVVTRGALERLTDEQLRAVLAHERAHIEGRHHLVRLAAEAFARAFPGLPLARRAREQTALLLEMIADDRALRGHSRDALATAMCEVAAGRAPRSALGAGGSGTTRGSGSTRGSGGSGALIRLRRILTPEARPRRVTRFGVLLACVTAPFLPLLVAC
ncbi:M56 family metallopeptidase [Streptomyces sp. NPDC020875]|uniref:M56 family metallopeptidase n=1 Tax=Streptomyces sp. NPDC020875 TaxID=3154898 RepID=UPI0033EBD819